MMSRLLELLAGCAGPCSARCAATLAAALLIAACGGGSEPREQTADPRADQFTGQVFALESATPASGVQVRAKGATGLLRTSAPTLGERYAVSASGLTGPYLVVSGLMGTVSTRTGTVNLNELARLQTALLLGQFPTDALASFGNGSPSLARITEPNLAEARTRLAAFLQDAFGVTVAADAPDFINTPFEAVPGDPVYDTLTALHARIAAIGIDAYAVQIEAAVAEARRCIASRVTVTIAGTTTEFCPATQTSTPDANDALLLTHVFTTQAGARLTLRTRERTLIDARYAPTSGAAFTCAGAACTGFSVGAAAANGTRPIALANATVSRRGVTTAALNGTLVAPTPGVLLPTLPCADNRFFLVLPDRSVIADCVSNTVVDLGLTGTFGTQQGQTTAGVYPFRNIDGSNGLPPSDPPTTVHLVLDGGTLLNVTVTRTDPATGALTLDYKCRAGGTAGGCTGVTIGAAVVNSDSGFNATLRRVTFDATSLAAVNADGSLAASPVALLSGTFTAVFIDRAELGLSPPTSAEACVGTSESVSYAPSNETVIYALCPELAGLPAPSANTVVNDDGGLRISFPATGAPLPGDPPPDGDVLVVTTDAAGNVTRVVLDPTSPVGSSFGASFVCNGNCSGVTVSAPGAGGERTVTFAGAVLRLAEPDGFADDPRSAVLDGRFTAPPP